MPARRGTGPKPWEGLAARRAETPLEQEGATAPPVPPLHPQELGRKANGRRAWGVLQCEIDQAGGRLDQAQSAEDFQYLAVLYKGLVAGEVQRIVEMPEHAGRVAIVYSGGVDFAVTGAWDALLSVASEFHRFWSPGRGWVMARDLKVGDVLRTLGGVAAVELVDPGEVVPVYNLDVAEAASFFVGRLGSLVHDNTLPDLRATPFDAAAGLAAARGPGAD